MISKRTMLATVALAAMACAASLPARAVTFDMTLDTVNRTNGYDVTLKGLTTDGGNVAVSCAICDIVGFGSDAFLNGPVSIITPGSPEGLALQGVTFNFDGKAFSTPDYFSNVPNSGIVLKVGNDLVYINPYLNTGDHEYYGSIANGGGPTNPGDLLSVSANVSPTPLPAALPMFASGLAAVGGLGFWRRKRKKAA